MSNPPEMAECKRCGKTVPRSDMFGVQDDLHCEDCSKGVRDRMRTRQAPTLGTSTFWATKLILGICVSFFILTDLIFRGQTPTWLGAITQTPQIWIGEWWRHIGPIFLHAGVLHIAMNSMAFWFLGRVTEFGFGAWTLIGLTLFTGIAASAVQWIFSGPTPGVGLSGAIFGYCGFLLALRRHHPVAMQIMDKRMQNNVWAMLAIGFVLSWTGAMAIGNGAHVGGLVAGFAFGAVSRLPQRKILVPMVAVACISLVVVAQFVSLNPKVELGRKGSDGSFHVEETITGAEYRRRYLREQGRD